MLVSSVEIVGADGQVQVVHFPVPEWIKTYWNYPLVQKAKVSLPEISLGGDCSIQTGTQSFMYIRHGRTSWRTA